MWDADVLSQAKAVLDRCRETRVQLAIAESCTGGLVSAILTAIPGSSAVLERGFVSYSNLAKTELLSVPAALIARHGAVSHEVAGAMAEGSLLKSAADISVSITGIAGPGGGSPEKPVGLVYFGLASWEFHQDAEEEPSITVHTTARHFEGDRDSVRQASVLTVYTLLLEKLGSAEI